MRVFIAVDLPASAREGLGMLQRRLVECGARGRCVEEDDMHITLRFFADLSDEQVDLAAEAVKATAALCPAPLLTICGVGGFLRSGGDTVYARLGGDIPALERIYDVLSHELDIRGIRKEARLFVPHITLMRSADYKAASGLAVKSDIFFGLSITMYRSILKPTGPEYDALICEPLAR